MESTDFTAIARMSRGFWIDEHRALNVSAEAVSAVGAMDLTEDRAIEHASLALLQRALRDGSPAKAMGLNHPFWRLGATERFTLIALHRLSWSYGKIAKILDIEEDKIEEFAWTARLTLSSSLPLLGISKITHPVGPTTLGVHCPQFDPVKPWTQRFMDEQCGKREYHFLKNHLIACDKCRDSLSRCRDFYYQLDAALPSLTSDYEIKSSEHLFRVWKDTRAFLKHEDMTFVRSLQIFFSREEVKMMMVVFVMMILVGIIV